MIWNKCICLRCQTFPVKIQTPKSKTVNEPGFRQSVVSALPLSNVIHWQNQIKMSSSCAQSASLVSCSQALHAGDINQLERQRYRELISPWSASFCCNKEPSRLPGIRNDSPTGVRGEYVEVEVERQLAVNPDSGPRDNWRRGWEQSERTWWPVMCNRLGMKSLVFFFFFLSFAPNWFNHCRKSSPIECFIS